MTAFVLKAYVLWIVPALVLVAASGCMQPGAVDAHGDEAEQGHDHNHDHESEGGAMAGGGGGIPIPSGVRDNLGITFAKVTPRAVAATRRVPGEFELLPSARHEYRAPLGGRVTLHLAQFDPVSKGDVLFTVDSPEWRRIQHEAVEAEGDIVMAEAALDVARARRNEVRENLGKQQERLENLAAVNVRKAELEAEVITLRSSLPRLEAEIRAQEATLREAREHYASRLNQLSTVTGIGVEELRTESEEGAQWRSIGVLPVRAEHAGVVENLAVNDGGWLEAGALALEVLDPEKVRFHAEAPQGDIGLFEDGQRARVVPPLGSSIAPEAALAGTLKMGLTANERDRTLSLYVTPDELAPWARAGVGGFLEVTITKDAPEQLSIPEAAVVQDGLEHIFFRRDPKNPDRALRVVADMGERDGRYVVVRSGVKAGDEVVLDGVYALKLSSTEEQAPDGYHYHADGSLHSNH
jgi:hypothetical protein